MVTITCYVIGSDHIDITVDACIHKQIPDFYSMLNMSPLVVTGCVCMKDMKQLIRTSSVW